MVDHAQSGGLVPEGTYKVPELNEDMEQVAEADVSVEHTEEDRGGCFIEQVEGGRGEEGSGSSHPAFEFNVCRLGLDLGSVEKLRNLGWIGAKADVLLSDACEQDEPVKVSALHAEGEKLATRKYEKCVNTTSGSVAGATTDIQVEKFLFEGQRDALSSLVATAPFGTDFIIVGLHPIDP